MASFIRMNQIIKFQKNTILLISINIIFSMVQFTFDGLFRTTNKGLPDNTANIDPYTYLSMNHFVYSLIVQIVMGLLLTGYTGLAVYRAFYKIKNQKFFSTQTPPEQQPEKQSIKSKSENDEKTNDNLIYRFDQDDHQKQKDQEKQEEEEEQNQENEVEEQNVSEQTTEWFLDLDHKVIFFQPFLISFVVAVNIFASNIFVIILLGLALVSYFVFNIKLYCSKYSILQSAFAVPCILTFLCVFFEDRDMST